MYSACQPPIRYETSSLLPQKLSVEMFGASLGAGGSGEEHSCEGDIDWGPGQASPRGGRGGWSVFSTRGRGRGRGRGASLRGRGECTDGSFWRFDDINIRLGTSLLVMVVVTNLLI